MVEEVQVDDLAAPKQLDQEEQKSYPGKEIGFKEESEDTVAAGEAERNVDQSKVDKKKSGKRELGP